MKGRLKKNLVIFSGVLFTLFGIVIFSSMQKKSNSYDQEKIDPGEADKIKAILLRPEGWIAEWNCTVGPTSGDAITDLLFEGNGKKFVVKINDPVRHYNCKRKVTITSNGFKMAGCYYDTVQLIFDPNDKRYPFKGESQSCVLKLKAK